MGEIIGFIIGLAIFWMFFGELIMAFLELIWAIICGIGGIFVGIFEGIVGLFTGAKEKAQARKDAEAALAARRQRDAEKAGYYDFTAISQLPDDLSMLDELHADFTKKSDSQRAFICKMKADELRMGQYMDSASKALAGGKMKDAVNWWIKAANLGSGEAAFRVAKNLADTAKSFDEWSEAKEWAEKAIKKNYPGAEALHERIRTGGLATINEMDETVKAAKAASEAKEWPAAIALWQKALKLGYPNCEKELAFAYLYSAQTIRDYEQALEWIGKAKPKSESEKAKTAWDALAGVAHKKLGDLYDDDGRKSQSLQHYRKASDLGNADAAHMVALTLLLDAKYKSDLDEPERYARLALQRGAENAQKTLDMIREMRYK